MLKDAEKKIGRRLNFSWSNSPFLKLGKIWVADFFLFNKKTTQFKYPTDLFLPEGEMLNTQIILTFKIIVINRQIENTKVSETSF